MKHQNPAFDLMFGSNISAFQKQLENHQRLTDRMSMTESPVSLAIKEMEQNHFLNDVSKASSLAASIVNPINELINEHKNWNDKFKHVMSPIWEQMELFKQFREHSAKLADFISPSISDYIKNNVRTNYEDYEPISVVEASYLEVFEQIGDEIDSDTFQEVNEEIKNNPNFGEEIRILVTALHNTFLSNSFSEAIIDLINRRLNVKNPKTVRVITAVIILVYLIYSNLELDNPE